MSENTKNALVVGVGPGLGGAAARRLAADGYRVALAARNVDKMSELAKETGKPTEREGGSMGSGGRTEPKREGGSMGSGGRTEPKSPPKTPEERAWQALAQAVLAASEFIYFD